MSNLTSKITDTYFPKDEQHFFKLFLRFLLFGFWQYLFPPSSI